MLHTDFFTVFWCSHFFSIEKGICMLFVFGAGSVPTWHSAPVLPPPPWQQSVMWSRSKVPNHGTAHDSTNGNGWRRMDACKCWNWQYFSLDSLSKCDWYDSDRFFRTFRTISTISSIWFLFLLIQTDSKVMWFPSMNLTFDTTVFHWPCFSHLPHTLCIMHVPEMDHFFAPITRTAKPRPANISDVRRDFYATRRGERCGSTHPTAWLSVAKCSHVGWHVGTRGTSWGYWSPCWSVGVWRFFYGSDGSKNLLVTLVQSVFPSGIVSRTGVG